MLMFLFVYPLKEKSSKCHYSKQLVSDNHKSDSTSPPMNDSNLSKVITVVEEIVIEPASRSRMTSPTTNSPSSAGIRLIMKKTFIFVALTLIVDVFAQLFSKYIPATAANKRIHAMVFDITAFVNLFCLILSFATYKKILTSIFHKY